MTRDPVVARTAPFAVFILFLIAASIAPSRAQEIVLLRGVVVACALAWFWRSYRELIDAPRTRLREWVIAIGSGVGVFLLWINVDAVWARTGESAGFAPLHGDGSVNWAMAAIRLAGLALVVPVMEELFWRSFVLRWIERHDFLSVVPRTVGAKAFIFTTILFALEHDRWFAAIFAGAIYNVLYMRTGNIWVPIVAHAVTNAVLGVWVLGTGRWEFW